MKQGQVELRRAGRLLATINGAFTETAAERMRGLLGSAALAPGDSLWIGPCNSVHCWFMKYTIDVVYLDGQGGVVKLVEALRPWRMSGCLRAASVLELAAGEIERLLLRLGDEVVWCD